MLRFHKTNTLLRFYIREVFYKQIPELLNSTLMGNVNGAVQNNATSTKFLKFQ